MRRAHHAPQEAAGGSGTDAFADTSHKDVSRLHAHIWLGGWIFNKALAGEEARDEFAVAVHAHIEPLSIPMPGETNGEEDHILQSVEFEGEGQELIGQAQAAPVGTDLDGDPLDVLQALPPLLPE